MNMSFNIESAGSRLASKHGPLLPLGCCSAQAALPAPGIMQCVDMLGRAVAAVRQPGTGCSRETPPGASMRERKLSPD